MATTPYPFVANAILTASQLNSTFNITVSTKTASYTLVAADAGTRVVMNSASATTITVNTSLFSAGDNLQILNIGAGVCTVTAGTATVATSGTLALVANAGGTLYFTSTGVSVFEATGVASSGGGLIPVVPTSVTVGSGSASTSANGTVTFTGATTVLLNGVFTSTYTNYRVLFHGLGSSNNNNLRSRYAVAGTASITTYTAGFIAVDYSSSAVWTYVAATGSAYNPMGWIDNAGNSNGALAVDFYSPAVAVRTFHNGLTTSVAGGTANSGGVIMGMHESATAYDGIQFFNSAGTNMTGKMSVYGYAQ